jgi:Ca-activated chloride channel family protein
MTWGHSMALGWALLSLMGLLWWALMYHYKTQQKRFVSDTMHTRISTQNAGRQRWRIGLWIAALACLILAAMQPRYGYVLEDKETHDPAIVLAIDVSKSMAAEDLNPSRFEIARQQMLATLESFPNSPMGLIVFAGDAYLQCPLTTDHDALRSYIQELYPGFLPVQGTNIAAVLRVATDIQATIRGPFNMFLFSDGEALSGDIEDHIAPLAKKGVRIYTIGLGKPAGEPIPLRDKNGQLTGHKHDTNGNIVLSKLDAKTLTDIATATKGRYINSTDDRAIEQLLALIDTEKSKSARAAQVRRYNEWYMVPLSLGLFLLALQWVLPDKRPPSWPLGILLILGLSMLPQSVMAASAQDTRHYRQGKSAYEKGDYSKAAASFTKVAGDNPQNYYNLGNTAYQANALEEAAAYYENAEPYMKTASEKAWLTYNQGNTAFRQGKFKEAAAFYRQSLTHNPTDKDTKMNLELALKKMKENKTPPPPPPNPAPPQPPKNAPKPREDKKKSEANQTLKTLRQKEQFNTMPPNSTPSPTEKDW